jgi:pyridoxine 5-phosphate synthase
MPKLGVNIDHIATIRQARQEFEPDPITAAKLCLSAGADSIVAHLREDRRHINDKDIKAIRKLRGIIFNLEMSLNPDVVNTAARIKPDIATIVPEKRQELTTEGGLDVIKNFKKIRSALTKLTEQGITVSLFIDPVKQQILKVKELEIRHIELHTGSYAQATSKSQKMSELNKLKQMARFAHQHGIHVAAGHGLKYHDTRPVAKIKEIQELNIGHSIISRAVFIGLKQAVREMKKLTR